MTYPILLQDLINYLIAEMCTIICVKARGVPKREKILLRRNWATTLASFVRVGIASTHFET